jgi:hypothetical protein
LLVVSLERHPEPEHDLYPNYLLMQEKINLGAALQAQPRFDGFGLIALSFQ